MRKKKRNRQWQKSKWLKDNYRVSEGNMSEWVNEWNEENTWGRYE